jgi:hypothetical protein
MKRCNNTLTAGTANGEAIVSDFDNAVFVALNDVLATLPFDSGYRHLILHYLYNPNIGS